jgi:assimilatory nitrate reductase catalytic subunit
MATATHCPYCAFQCGIEISGTRREATIVGDASYPVNRGKLCVKGWTAASTLVHEERLRRPLVRNARGVLAPADWDEALARAASAVHSLQQRHGREGIGVFGSGALTNEKAYLLGKFARVALRTPNIDYNGRFCMSSGAAASVRAFGVDRGLPFPLDDIGDADVVLLAGGNVAETMPPFMQYLEAQRSNGGRLIVVDPRRSATAESATLHLALVPGTDAALANGLLHLLIRDRLVDRAYIAARTEGFDEVHALVAGYWPEIVERITGIPETKLVQTAGLLGAARSVMILTGRGPEQQARGVNNALAYINLALALGAPGRPSSGFGTITGQGNGQGGREHGQKADQLPGYRRIDDPAARRHVAAVWDVPEASLPGPGRSAFEMLDSMGTDGGVRALLVFGSNPLVSTPDAVRIEQRIRALDFLLVSDFFLSETATLADVVLPAAQWAEEEGTMTNLEGRVILRRRAFPPPASVRTDLEILCDLAAVLGERERFTYAGPEDVFQELRRASAGGVADYAGINHARIEQEQGVFWPCRSDDAAGDRRLFRDAFPTPTGRARFHPVAHLDPAELPDDEYPLYLTTGRLLGHYQSGNQTRRVARLQQMAPLPTAQMHPSTARRHGLANGTDVTLVTRRGSARMSVEIVTGIREDTVFVPFHWGGEGSANRLTNPALDPISRMPEFKVCAVRLERPSYNGEG